jgi:hypothetical protein
VNAACLPRTGAAAAEPVDAFTRTGAFTPVLTTTISGGSNQSRKKVRRATSEQEIVEAYRRRAGRRYWTFGTRRGLSAMS